MGVAWSKLFDEDAAQRRVSHSMVSFAQLQEDVAWANETAPLFPSPATGSVLHFSLYSTLQNPALLPLFWRFRDNVVVSVTSQQAGLTASVRQREHRNLGDKASVLTVREFYFLYLFMRGNVHQLELEEEKRRRREEKIHREDNSDEDDDKKEDDEEPTPFPDDYDDDICPICQERPITAVLACAHAYCETCIDAWQRQSPDNTCPGCRKAMGPLKYGNEWMLAPKDEEWQTDVNIGDVVRGIQQFAHSYVAEKPTFEERA